MARATPSSAHQYVHMLEDGNGTVVGALNLHNEEGSKELLQESRVEVIAICKGWTNLLRYCDVPWMGRQDMAKEDKQGCYHVLWIEWENGVAYRKASGYVLEDQWDRLAEPDEVSVTLGPDSSLTLVGGSFTPGNPRPTPFLLQDSDLGL
ncbi:hypothetical protein ACHAQD_008900 [Fusarium lateritium]